MRSRLRSVRTPLVLLAAALLAACGSASDSAVSVVAIGRPTEPFVRGARLPFAAQLVQGSTAEGLVSFDEQGRVIPALADRWIVTDDGRSYIFRLRDGTWRDGTPLSAKTARAALDQSIRALSGTPLGLDLAGIDEVREMAARVVEVRLVRPMPHFLQLLAQPELGLRHAGRGAGPMVLARERDNALLTPLPPETVGLPRIESWNERVRPVRFVALPGEAAVQRFNRGDADLLLGGRIEHFPLASSVGLLRGTIQLDPVSGLFGLAVLKADGFLAEPANREALAMAIDREALIAQFGVGNWTPSTRIVAAGLDQETGTVGERWADLSLDARRQAAAARVAAWRKGPGRGAAVKLAIALPAGPGSDRLFAHLQRDFATIGVEVARGREDRGAVLVLLDDVARYPRAGWYLNRFNCATWRGLCDKGADILAAQARASADPAEAASLLADAEAELTQANVFIPFGPPVRWSLVRGDVTGFATNRWGWHPLMPMAMLPR